jgi:hypothetical protein
MKRGDKTGKKRNKIKWKVEERREEQKRKEKNRKEKNRKDMTR